MHGLETLLRREVDRERDHLGPRHHDVGDFLVREVEDLVEHLLLLAFELSRLGGAGKEHLQLGLGVRGAAVLTRRLETQDAQRKVGRFLQDPDQRLEDDEEPGHRGRHDERDGLRVAERHALRDQLADHDVQVRDDQEGEAIRDDRGRDRVEHPREDRLADGTDTQARDRDAELHGRDESRRVRGDAQDDAGPTASLVAELGEARASRGDQGVLGRDEERVQQEQASDCEELKAESHAAPLSGARGLGGWSSSTALVSEYR